jgi:hypothetical protein
VFLWQAQLAKNQKSASTSLHFHKKHFHIKTKSLTTMMNSLSTLVLALTVFGSADAKSIRAATPSASSQDIPDIATTRKLQSSEDIPDISASRMLSSLTEDEKERCYTIMDSTAVNDRIEKDGYVEFLNLLAYGYLSDNGITTYDELSFALKYAWTTLTCQCTAMGGKPNCCQADRANLFVAGSDGELVSEEQVNFLNDICKTAIDTLGQEGMVNPAPGELPVPPAPAPIVPEPLPAPQPAPVEPSEPVAPAPVPVPSPEPPIDGEEIEQELPAKPTPEVDEGLTAGAIIGMAVGIPILAIILLLATLFLCRDRDYKPKDGEVEDEELENVEKEDAIADEEDSAIATVQTDAEASTIVGV